MEYFRAQNKMFEEMRAGGAPDRDSFAKKCKNWPVSAMIS